MEGSRGNFTNDSREVLCCVVKQIPWCLVPFRYRTTLLTLSRWPLDGFAVYFARMLVMVAISGRVDMDNHVRQPISCCMRCFRRACASAFGRRLVGIESTG